MRVTPAFGEAVVGGFGVFGARLAALVASLVFVFPRRADIASLLLFVAFEARLAFATTGGQVPLAVPLAQVRRGLDFLRVIDAFAGRRLDHGHFSARRRCRETREVHRRLWACDVIHLRTTTTLHFTVRSRFAWTWLLASQSYGWI